MGRDIVVAGGYDLCYNQIFEPCPGQQKLGLGHIGEAVAGMLRKAGVSSQRNVVLLGMAFVMRLLLDPVVDRPQLFLGLHIVVYNLGQYLVGQGVHLVDIYDCRACLQYMDNRACAGGVAAPVGDGDGIGIIPHGV